MKCQSCRKELSSRETEEGYRAYCKKCVKSISSDMGEIAGHLARLEFPVFGELNELEMPSSPFD